MAYCRDQEYPHPAQFYALVRGYAQAALLDRQRASARTEKTFEVGGTLLGGVITTILAWFSLRIHNSTTKRVYSSDFSGHEGK